MVQRKLFITIMTILNLALQIAVPQDDMLSTAGQIENISLNNTWRRSDLSWEEWPDYYYFANAQQGHYNLTLEYTVAFIIKDYVSEVELDSEEWELKKIYFCEGVHQAFVESASGNELYIAFVDGVDQYDYTVMADIRRGDGADIILHDEKYSYNSMLEWHSYKNWLDDGKHIEDGYRLKIKSEIHDSIYGNGTFYALYDYLKRTGNNRLSGWEADDNDSYIGRNGRIAAVTCRNGTQTIPLIVDVANKTYAVVGQKNLCDCRGDTGE